MKIGKTPTFEIVEIDAMKTKRRKRRRMAVMKLPACLCFLRRFTSIGGENVITAEVEFLVQRRYWKSFARAMHKHGISMPKK